MIKLKLYHDIFDRSTPPLEQAEYRVEQEKSAESWHELALAHFQKLQFGEAVAACDWAIHLDPDGWEPHYHRAMGLTIMGKFGEAITDLDVVLSKVPDHFGALYNRGRLYARLNRHDEALADLQRAQQQDGRRALALRVPQAIRALRRRRAGRATTPFDALRDWLDERRAGEV